MNPSMSPAEAIELLQFATPKQAEILQHIIEGGTVHSACKELNLDNANTRRALNGVRKRAMQALDTPGMEHSRKEGYKLAGYSTLYDQDGNMKAQWVKMMADRERQTQMLLERLEAGSTAFKQFKPTKGPAKCESDLAAMLTITDFHFGMYAWEAETGDDWDVEISREVFLNGIHDMIQASPNAELGILNQLGDFLHWDGLLAVTPSHGHVLDSDTRYGKLVDMCMDVMTEAIKMMLKKYKRVYVLSCEGNHDEVGSIWLRKHLKHVFANEPRVEVNDNAFPYYAMLHGDTLLCFHHGHKIKLNQMHKLFASEPRFRQMWGSAKHTYIHAGHFHHEKVVEDGGAIAIQHPTLAARDAYSARGGWVSQRAAKMFTYHKTEGEVQSYTVRPRLS